LTTTDGGPDWVGIVTVAAGVELVATGLFNLFVTMRQGRRVARRALDHAPGGACSVATCSSRLQNDPRAAFSVPARYSRIRIADEPVHP
jgi:hypothetical protein